MSFHEILEAARKRDKAALRSMLATNNSIDVWRKSSHKWSALSECASKNDMDAVLFLLDNHANINYAIRGAAFGGYFAEVKAWLLLPGADIGYAIFGAAQGGHFQQVEKWLKLPEANINDAINGAALGGYFIEVETWLLQPGADINQAISGAALRGDFAEIERWLSRPHSNIRYAIISAAQGGYFIQVNEWFVSTRAKININDVLYGVALGGYFDEVERWLQRRGAMIYWAISGAAYGGHFQQAKKWLERSTPIDEIISAIEIDTYDWNSFYGSHDSAYGIAKNTAVGGHLKQMRYIKGIDAVIYSCSAIQNKNPGIQLRFLSEFNPQLIATLVSFLKPRFIEWPSNFSIEFADIKIDVSSSTTNQALLLSRIRRGCDVSFEAALSLADKTLEAFLDERHHQHSRLHFIPKDILYLVTKKYVGFPVSDSFIEEIESIISVRRKLRQIIFYLESPQLNQNTLASSIQKILYNALKEYHQEKDILNALQNFTQSPLGLLKKKARLMLSVFYTKTNFYDEDFLLALLKKATSLDEIVTELECRLFPEKKLSSSSCITHSLASASSSVTHSNDDNATSANAMIDESDNNVSTKIDAVKNDFACSTLQYALPYMFFNHSDDLSDNTRTPAAAAVTPLSVSDSAASFTNH